MKKAILALLLTTANLFAAESEPVQKVKVTNGPETRTVDVVLTDGVNRLAVDSLTVIDQLLGRDPQATSWFYIGTASDASGCGSAGDTVRIQIPAGQLPSLWPACDITTTVTSGMISSSNCEEALANQIVANFNANTNCSTSWKSLRIKDFTGVFVHSRLYNEFGERTSWTVTTTGTTVITKAYDDIIRRGFPTELARSPNNPRQGILGISGTVTTLPGGIGSFFFQHLLNAGNPSMLVNGSLVSPITFTFSMSSSKDIFVEQLRCFGGGGSLKFEQFLSKNTALTNGILITIKSDNEITSLDPITVTEEFKNHFAIPSGTDFRIDIQSGSDQFLAIFRPTLPFPLRKSGTFGAGNDDYVKALIRDDLRSVGSELECLVIGFTKEP